MVKIIVLALLFVVLFGLFRALYFLVSQKGDKHAVAHNLTIRVVASGGILLFLVFAKWMGWHEFNSSPAVSNNQPVQVEQQRDEKTKQ